jgi:predicted secreted protein
MSRQNGRDINIRDSADALVSTASATISINNSPVPVTENDDLGFVTVLERPSTKQVTLSISGFHDEDDTRFLDKSLAVAGTTMLEDFTIEFMDSATGVTSVVYAIEGTFHLGSYSATGAQDGAIEFTAELASSGAFNKKVLV